MAKATKTTVAQRVNEVLSMRLAGAAFAEIVQHAAEKEWGVNERQIRNYIQASDELLAESFEKDRPKLLALHLAQRRLLMNRALETGDYGTALRVLDSSAKLQDLFPAKLSGLDAFLNTLPAELAGPTRAALVNLLFAGRTAESSNGHANGFHPVD